MTELVLLSMQGDKEAFSELMERSSMSMYKIARSFFSEQMDVDDSIAETVMICWKTIDSLRQPEYFRTWLCRILINTCIKMRSSKDKTVSLEELEESGRTACVDGPAEDGFAALMELTDEKYRTEMVLYYGEGFSVSEISSMLGLPRGTVTSHLKRGRDGLAKKLREEDYFE